MSLGNIWVRDKDKELYNENRPGLYLFTVKAEDFYSLHYIGMTTGGLSSRIVGTGEKKEYKQAHKVILSKIHPNPLIYEQIYVL